MALDAVYEAVAKQVAALGLPPQTVGRAVHEIFRGQLPEDLQDDALDVLYRLTWALHVREVAGNDVGLFTAVARVDLLEAGAMALDEVFDDLRASAACQPIWLPERSLGPHWTRSANATKEVLAWSRDDLRLLVDVPIGLWRGEDWRIDRWTGSDAQVRLLERGAPEDYLPPETVAGWVAFAERLLEFGNLDDVLPALDEAQALGLPDGQAAHVRGRLLEGMGEPQRAEAELLAALELGVPEPLAVLHDLGMLYARAGAIDAALPCFDQVLEAAPDHLEALKVRGTLLTQAGRFDDGLRDLDRALAIAPDLVELHHARAAHLHARGDVQGALQAISEGLRLDITSAPLHDLLGECLEAAGELEEAFAAYTDALRLGSEGARAPRALLGARLGRHEEVVDDCTALLDAGEDSEELLALRAAGCVALGRPERAISDHLTRMRRGDQGAEAALRRLGFEGPYPWPEVPMAGFLRAVAAATDPAIEEEAGALEDEALWRAQNGDLEGAYGCVMRIRSLVPASMPATLLAARFAEQGGRPDLAETHFDEATALCPEAGMPWALRAEMYVREGVPDRALLAIDEALLRYDFEPGWHVWRGTIFGLLGRHPEAAAAFERSLALDPGAREAWDGLGVARSALGDRQGALAAYDTLVRLYPDASAFVNRGLERFLVGNVAGAVADWWAANAVDPFHPQGYFKRALAEVDTHGRTWSAWFDLAATVVVASPEWEWREQAEQSFADTVHDLDPAEFSVQQLRHYLGRLLQVGWTPQEIRELAHLIDGVADVPGTAPVLAEWTEAAAGA